MNAESRSQKVVRIAIAAFVILSVTTASSAADGGDVRGTRLLTGQCITPFSR